MRIVSPTGKKLVFNGKSVDYKEDFLYLTYFNNFNTNTLTDTPLIGPQTTYSSTVNIKNYTWAGKNVTFAYPNIEGYYRADIPLELPKIISLEIVVFATGSGSSSGGSPYGFIDKNNNGFGRACLTNVICLDVNNYNIQLKNGSRIERSYSNQTYVVKDQIYNQFVKCAFVCNNETKVVKCYFNGLLVATISNSNYDFSKIGFTAYKFSSYIFDYSQVCIRNGDHSINNGNNYPIESEPYRSI